MDLQQMRLLRALAEMGNFSKAAQKCNISQPAMSIHIQNLEEEFGMILVERLPRGAQLTEAGTIVLEYSQKILSMVDKMQLTVRELSGLKRGHLKIGASTTPGIYTLPDALGRFKQKHPDVEVDLRIGNTQQVEEAVSNREIILGIIGQKPGDPELHWEHYLKDVLVAIVSPQHKFAKRKSISVTDLTKEPFIQREEGSNTRKTCDEAFQRHGVRMKIAMELGSTEAIKRAVAANLGVAIVSPYTLVWELKHRRLVALKLRESGFQREFNLIYRRGSRLPPSAAAFLKMLKS
jgi:LysR family transcriptional regulator, low CO2-responsive transcriptional regulator